MDFPDDKALRGFRSKAQSRWAHATDQWWADEYEKHTNYGGIPDRVNEDVNEGIETWGDPINEVHPVVGVFDDATERLNNAQTPEEFVDASKRIFRAAKIWDNDDKLKGEKIVTKFVGQYTTMVDVLEKWRDERFKEIPKKVWRKWEEFIDRHGNPEDDVWGPWKDQMDKEQLDREEVFYNWGNKLGDSIADESVADFINFEVMDNKEMHAPFLKGLFHGVMDRIGSDETAALPVNENALVRKASRTTGFDKELIQEFWEESIKEQKQTHSGNERKGKQFWNAVVEKFKTKIRHLDILEAKRVMTDRKALRKSIDSFIDKMATGEYAEAQGIIPEMVRNQLGTMINRKKEAFLKDMGKQVKERAKEG